MTVGWVGLKAAQNPECGLVGAGVGHQEGGQLFFKKEEGGEGGGDRAVACRLRACTTHRRLVIRRTSILSYRQIERQLIEPIDRHSVCKLFNAFYVSKDQLQMHLCVYHCVCGYLIE
jgi:hypothetical protein